MSDTTPSPHKNKIRNRVLSFGKPIFSLILLPYCRKLSRLSSFWATVSCRSLSLTEVSKKVWLCSKKLVVRPAALNGDVPNLRVASHSKCLIFSFSQKDFVLIMPKWTTPLFAPICTGLRFKNYLHLYLKMS